MWDNSHADAQLDPVTSSQQDPITGKWYNISSELTPFATTTGYWNFLVANSFYNSLQPYTYTPFAGNLGANDTWSLVWPSASNVKGYLEAGTGVYSSTVTGHMDPIWIEPLPGEVTSNMKIDWIANRIDMVGPFDGLNWSKNSQGAQEVRDNWSRIGMLPRGVPCIEFGVNSLAESAHAPITALSMPTTTQYTHDTNHNFYTHYATLGQSISMVSVGYNIGGSITNYTWDFGDGNHSYTASTSYTWENLSWEGRQVTVNLTTKNNYGLTSTNHLKVNLTSNVPPVATFVVSGATQYSVTQLATSFNASASSDPNGHVTKYWWSFGDGTTAVSTSPLMTHQYSKMGNYKVFLNVSDNGTSKSGPINSTNPCIFTLGIQTQVCAKIVMPDTATVSTSVAMSGSKSFSFNVSRTIVNYTWYFGDGGQGWGLTPSHTWTSVGTYIVTLKVKDSIGAWSPNMTSRIYIGTAAVTGLSLTLSRHSAFPGESMTLTIKAVDGAGKFVPTADLYVNVSGNLTGWTGLPLVNYHITSGIATISGISCTRIGAQNITATKYANPSISGSEFVTIANRTVEITVYGLGQMPLGSDVDVYSSKNLTRSYWNPLWRGKWGDYPLRYGAMALNEYISGGEKIGSNVDTTDYVHVEARNLSEVNMASMMFFPRLNASTGGQVSFDWSYHYLNYSEFWYWNDQSSPDPVQLPQNPYTFRQYDITNWGQPSQFYMYSQSKSAYDGWETWQTIDITMDQSAAYQMLRMPASHFTTDPVAWWDEIDPSLGESKNMTVQRLWEQGFMVNEFGSSSKAGRLDIKSCDDGYAWNMGYWGSIFRLVDNHDGTITMTIDRVGYGEDFALARWLYWGGVSSGWNYPNGTPKGIVPWEPYYDRFSMSGDIDSTSANVTLDAGNIYAWRAQKSGDPNVPADTAVWRWEQLRIDYAPTTWVGTNNRSEMDLWIDAGVTFDSWDPAGTAWGRMGYAPDQSPNIIYLDVGESLIIQRPRTAVSGILPGPLVGDASRINDRIGSGYDNWIQIQEKWGNATIHPLGCYPKTAIVDKGTGDLKIVGPFVPKINHYTDPGLTWLWRQSAPLIEYWIQ